MTHTNASKFKGLVTRLLKKIELGKPFKISFQGNTASISQEQINSLKEKHGGFLIPLVNKVISHIKGGNGLETKEGGLLPLAALLPMIFGGLAAAGGTAGGIAFVVNASNQKAKNDQELKEQKAKNDQELKEQKAKNDQELKEQRRHNEAVEKGLKEGKGIFLNPYKGKALKDILIPVIDKIDGIHQEGKKQVRSVIKALTPFFKIYEVKDGSGVFFEPR